MRGEVEQASRGRPRLLDPADVLVAEGAGVALVLTEQAVARGLRDAPVGEVRGGSPERDVELVIPGRAVEARLLERGARHAGEAVARAALAHVVDATRARRLGGGQVDEDLCRRGERELAGRDVDAPAHVGGEHGLEADVEGRAEGSWPSAVKRNTAKSTRDLVSACAAPRTCRLRLRARAPASLPRRLRRPRHAVRSYPPGGTLVIRPRPETKSRVGF